MNTIYHYTDLNGFFNILQTKKLWLSATNNLNDYAEIRWFIGRIHQKVRAIKDERYQNISLKLLEFLSINNGIPYICSFSQNGDLLSQWRAYADDGQGFAIGFNEKFFNYEMELPVPGVTTKITMGKCRVVYDETHQDIVIDEILHSLKKVDLTDPNSESTWIAEAGTRLLRFSKVAKNSAFKEEKEVRIIHTPVISGNTGGETHLMGNISDLKHRVSRGRITSYFELDFSNENNEKALNEVVLGPKSSVSDFDIETFMSLNGYGTIPHRRSAATYR